jgi:hypothetical protein
MVNFAAPLPATRPISFQANQPDPQVDATNDLEASQRTRALAEALRQQSFDPIAANGGNISWTQGIAKLAQALVASRLEHKANVGEWDAHAKQQATRRSIHYGDATPVDLSANPYRSDHERAALVKGLKNYNLPLNGPPVDPAPSINPALAVAGNSAASTQQLARAMQGKQLLATPGTGTGPVQPGPDTASDRPVQMTGSNIQPPARMDRLLSTMPADAAMYFEQSDPGAYWKAVSKAQEPADDERYAAHFGQTGSKEFNGALQDYRLRSYGPSAVDAREGLMGDRFGYQSDLQGDRLRSGERNTDVRTNASINNNIRSTDVTSRGQDLNHQDRVTGINVHHEDRVRGQTMTDNRVRGSASYQGTGGRGGGGAPAVAVGPNGHRIVVKNGGWVDAQTGQPVQ